MKGARANTNSLRIIGGSHRGRRIHFPDAPGLRPTGDRVRETLFNWLQPWIAGARCLDAFAGSGALGFEAASRGASQVIMLEQSPLVVRSLEHNAAQLGLTNLVIAHTDARHWLDQPTPPPLDIVFLDPPFAAGLLAGIFAQLETSGAIVPGGLIYVENDPSHPPPPAPAHWQLLKEKQAGRVAYRLWQRSVP